MKKTLLVLAAALVLFCVCIYIFIPGKLNISSAAVINTTENSIDRYIMDELNWRKWWNYSQPASTTKEPADVFLSNGVVFKLTEKFYKSATISIQHDEQQVASKLAIIPLGLDSTGIEWKYSVITSANPFKRFTQYLKAKEIKKNMDEVLSNLRLFLAEKGNIYGIQIERTSLKDTLFITTKSILKDYPTTPDIYNLIKKIQLFAAKQSIKQTGSPIFNITETDSKQFQLMAAIPADKSLPDVDGFAFKKMIKGSFMVSEVVGGEYTVAKASKSLQQYFTDYKKTSMALNFTMLITDRMYQPDTTKWITRLYQPVY